MAKKNKVIIAVLIAALVGGGGYTAYSTVKNVQGTMTALTGSYSVIAAGENDLSKTISSTGTVIGNGTVDVTTKLSSAEVSEVNVSIGDHVKKGDVLCVFDNTEIQEQYDSLKKKIKNSDKKTENSHEKNERDLETAKKKKKTAVARAQRAYNKAVRERDDAYNKYNNLVNEYNSHLNDEPAEDGMGYDFDTVGAQIDALYEGLSAYDDAVTAAQDTYNDTIDQWDETIQEYQDVIDAEEFTDDDDSRKELDELKEQLDQCTVTAPQDGVITALNVNEGTIPQAASLMTIVNTEKTVIELTVKETDITHLSEGMEAVVTSKVLPDEKFPAKITRLVNVLSTDEASISAEGGASSGGSSGGYKVEITLDEPNDKLLIGMTASVEITIDAVGKKLSVPYSGVVQEDDKSFVYVATADKKEEGSYTAKKVEITTGAESDFYTEVTGGDIKEGDLIIENPQGDDILQPVTDGGRIMVNE